MLRREKELSVAAWHVKGSDEADRRSPSWFRLPVAIAMRLETHDGQHWYSRL